MCCVLSRVRLSVTPWTVAHQAPLSWNSPGKNTGVGCHRLLQGLFLTQGLNLHLLGLLLAGGFFTTIPPGKPWVDTQRCAVSSSGLSALFWAQCPLAEQELFH